MTTMAARFATAEAWVASQSLRSSTTFASIAAYSGGSETSVAIAWIFWTPAWIPLTTSTTWGTNASAITVPMATMIRRAPRVTTPAAFARPHPRRRSAITYGANVAATMPATRTDAVVVESWIASQITTTPKPIVARMRQPTAPSHVSHSGVSAGRGASSAGGPSCIGAS